jgi:predicted DNA-binding transcriptional regulator YafY
MKLVNLLQATKVGLTFDDIRNRLEITQRMFENMRLDIEGDYPDTPLVRAVDDKGRARWRIDGKAVDFDLSVEASELVALQHAINLLHRQNLPHLAEGVLSVSTKAKAQTAALDDDRKRHQQEDGGFISGSKLLKAELDAEEILQHIESTRHPFPTTSFDQEVLNDLEQAIITHQRIDFDYQDPFAKEPHSIFNHCPVGLLYGSHSFLVAFAFSKPRRMKSFRLDRITRLRVQDDTFNLPPKFNLEEISARSYGASLDETPKRVILEFSQKASQEGGAYQFHPNQSLKVKKNKLQITFTTGGFADLCRELIRWEGMVKIIEPAELKEEMRRQLELGSNTVA